MIPGTVVPPNFSEADYWRLGEEMMGQVGEERSSARGVRARVRVVIVIIVIILLL